MSHILSGIIADKGSRRHLEYLFPESVIVEMRQGCLFLTIDGRNTPTNEQPSQIIAPFEHLTIEIEEKLRIYSADWGVVYLETEYFGGTGTQSAMSWINSDILNEPTSSDTTWSQETQSHKVSNGHPINACLKSIGIERISGLDEFDSVGIGSIRQNPDQSENRA